MHYFSKNNENEIMKKRLIPYIYISHCENVNSDYKYCKNNNNYLNNRNTLELKSKLLLWRALPHRLRYKFNTKYS